MTPDRIRLSELADQLGVDFGGLFNRFANLFPEHIDDDVTVPAQWGPVLEQVDGWLPTLESGLRKTGVTRFVA